MRIIIRVLLFLFPFYAWPQPQAWSFKHSYKLKEGTKIRRSVIEFNKGKVTHTYKPEKIPYGVVMKDWELLNDVYYLVSGWPENNNRVLFRIFDPEHFKEKPICELSSYSAKTDLRIKKGYLELAIYPKNEDKKVWARCARLRPQKVPGT